MSDPAELLAMMTAHGIQIGHVPGSVSRMTALDVAGAMGISHVPPHCQMLVLAKLCLDESARHQAWSYWFRDRVGHYRAAGAKWCPGQLRALVDHTLAEYLDANACRSCDGVGSRLVDHQFVECEPCGGSGRRYASERAMARAFGVDRRLYARLWAPRIAESRRELHRWEYEALMGVAQGLGFTR